MTQTQELEAGMKIQVINSSGKVLDTGLVKSVIEGSLGTLVESESLVDSPGYITEFAHINNQWYVLFESPMTGERGYNQNGSTYELRKIE